MSNVLLLSLVFAPDGVSTALLMSELAQELHEAGHNLTVLTTTPHYNVEPEARAKQPLRKRWFGLLYESEYAGMTVYHASIPVKGSRVGGRLLDYLRFHAISTLAGLTIARDYDIMLVPSPPLTIGISAWILKLFSGKPFIYNVQEIYPDVAVKLGMLTNRKAIRFFEWMESFIYHQSKAITVISERFRQVLRGKGVPDERLVIIPNFVDTEFIQPSERRNDFSIEHKLNEKFVVLYAGNIGLTQSFETIMQATRQLVDLPDLVFLIVGDGTRRAWLEEELATNDYPNVTLLPYQPRSVVPQIYATADLCLVPLKKGTAQDTFPSKIYTIMAAGRPVVASADPDSELADVVDTADCGWHVLPDDAADLEQAIRNAYTNRESAQAKGLNGRHYVVSHHSRQVVTAKYDALIRQSAPGQGVGAWATQQ